MAEETDADKIQRDRDRQRREERTRIEQDRRERELELARLRRAELLQDMEEKKAETPRAVARADRGSAAPRAGGEHAKDSADAPPVVRTSASGAHPAPPSAERGAAPEEAPPGSRAIGGEVRSRELERFLRLDPAEKFDIQQLNVLRLPEIVPEVTADPKLAEQVERRIGALMHRVKGEVDDPLNAGAFLREQVLLWFRTSPTDPEWTQRMPGRWAGIFADSRVTGGRLLRWLNARLLALHDGVVPAGRLSSRIRKGLRGSGSVESSVARTPTQQIQAETAQALLDDLSARARAPEEPFPLVRLSELAVRRQVPTVNEALSQLFSSPEIGPFILLHPNRYPDCDELQIRAPTPTASGAALAYVIVGSRSHRAVARGISSTIPSGSREGGGRAEAAEEEEQFDSASIWESTTAASRAWPRLLEELRKEKRRLDSPPKDFRVRPAYAALRDLLVDQPEVRKAFLAVRWRGRPAGLPLLVGLLQKGSIAPDVATDFEYLEAELGAWAADDPDWKPEDATWKFRDWTVTREGSHQGGFRYKAQRSAESPPA